MTEQTYDPPMVFADDAPLTPVGEAVERVKAYVAGLEGHHGRMVVDVNAGRSFTLDDLRALLSALELGSVANASREGSTEPATPLSAELLASVSAGELADWAQAAFEGALPDDATPYDVGRAFASVGEHLHAVLAERLEEISAARTTPCPADCDCTADCAALSASTTDSGRLDAEARLHAEAETGREPAEGWSYDMTQIPTDGTWVLLSNKGWGKGMVAASYDSVERRDRNLASWINGPSCWRVAPALPPAPPTGEGGGL